MDLAFFRSLLVYSSAFFPYISLTFKNYALSVPGIENPEKRIGRIKTITCLKVNSSSKKYGKLRINIILLAIAYILKEI